MPRHKGDQTRPLFTIGYERRSLGEYMAALEEAGVTVPPDVRDTS